MGGKKLCSLLSLSLFLFFFFSFLLITKLRKDKSPIRKRERDRRKKTIKKTDKNLNQHRLRAAQKNKNKVKTKKSFFFSTHATLSFLSPPLRKLLFSLLPPRPESHRKHAPDSRHGRGPDPDPQQAVPHDLVVDRGLQRTGLARVRGRREDSGKELSGGDRVAVFERADLFLFLFRFFWFICMNECRRKRERARVRAEREREKMREGESCLFYLF